jgi:DNA excision repair protein ERCC-3
VVVLATHGTREEEFARKQMRHLAEKGVRVNETVVGDDADGSGSDEADEPDGDERDDSNDDEGGGDDEEGSSATDA